MNRNLKHVLFWAAMVLPVVSHAQVQSINLSTGWNNGVVTTNNTPDDSWNVTLPNGTVTAPRTCSYGYWQESGASRWITPAQGGGQPSYVVAGTYTYRINFTVTTSRIDCARLIINAIGSDNRITGLHINGFNYTPSMPAGHHFNPLIYNQTLHLNPAHLILGVNTLTVTTYNNPDTSTDNPHTETGMNFSGELRLNDGDFNIHPVVTGPTTICEGTPLTFGGSLTAASSPATDHQWKLQECDANGNIVAGGFSYEEWFNGPPTGITFPATLNLPCGKYYMVILAAVRESGCANWASDNHQFYYTCKPTANAGADKTVCQGACTTISAAPAGKIAIYNWSANGTVVGTGATISVCPEVATTYTLTVTNTITGCTNTDQVTVTVLPNDPGFDILTNTDLPTYYTVLGMPNVMNANLVPGFGQFWAVEELDANGNSLYIIQNPNEWFPYPANCTFKGFDDYLVNYDIQPNVTDVHTSVPAVPASGRFMYNRNYRITRGTWNNNCTWNADAFLLTRTKSGNGNEVEVYPTKAPDFSDLVAAMREAAAGTWTIAPNPSNGIFHVSSDSERTESTTVAVFDVFGKQLQSDVLEAGTTLLTLDLSGHAKGIYIVNITTGGVGSTYKIILE
jgi:hypothetical protein